MSRDITFDGARVTSANFGGIGTPPADFYIANYQVGVQTGGGTDIIALPNAYASTLNSGTPSASDGTINIAVEDSQNARAYLARVVAVITQTEGIGLDPSDRIFLPPGMTLPTVDPYHTEVLADAPVVYWRLGDPSGTTMTDSSGNSHNGTYGTGVTLAQTGLITDTPTNTSAKGDGSHPLGTYAAGTGIPVGGSDRTFEFAFKTSVSIASDTYFISMGDCGSHHDLNIFAGASLGGMHVDVSGVGGHWSTPGSGDLADGRRHLCVLTFTAGEPRWFFDGVDQGPCSTTTLPLNTTLDGNGVVLGAYHTSASGFYGDLLDEVAIYDYALSPARIIAHWGARG